MTKAILLLFLPVLANAADVTGEWKLTLIRFGEEFAAARVSLKSDGTKVTGTLNELTLEGTLQGDRLSLTGMRPDGKEWGKLEGKLQVDDLAGNVKQGAEEFN